MDRSKENTRNNADRRKLKSAGILLRKKGLLVVLSPNFLGQTCVVDKPEIIIGRQDECELKIDDPLLSRKHCIVSMDENSHFFLEDMSSTNATFLNSKSLKKKTQLGYGDRIVVGNTILRFYFEEEIDKK
jgi:pSer/pThr/pTyr-binding forkhead associated (FHA) protein